MSVLKQVVVGIDFSESSRAALAQAVRIAQRSGAKVHAIHAAERSLLDQVSSTYDEPPPDLEERVISHARYGIERMASELGATTPVLVEVGVGHATDTLVQRCTELAGKSPVGEALLVMGTVGQSHPQRGVGATAARCVRHAPMDVLLVREGQAGPFKRIIVCVDFSETSSHALRAAAAIAKADGATLQALHVYSPPPPAYPPGDAIGLWPIPAPDFAELNVALREEAMKELKATITRAAAPVDVEARVVEDPSYARAICDAAKEHGADLVVIGTQGRSNLRYMLIGSTAEKVLREVHCSLLAVKPRGAQA